MAPRLLITSPMNELRDRLFVLTMMTLLPACIEPIEPVPGAQPSPTSTAPEPAGPPGVTASWKAPGATFHALAAASAGDEGAIAYVESSPAQITVKLQRLDGGGAKRGEAITLGVISTDALSGLTIASDGSRYITCWGDDAQITCATAPVSAGSASPGLVIAGTAPALAYNAGTLALAYGLPKQLAVVKITSDAVAAGSPTLFDAGDGMSFDQIPLLAATAGGFALVGGESVQLHLLDLSLDPVATPIFLGENSWFFAAIAASGTRTAIHLAKPYGSTTFLFDGAALLDSQSYGGGGKVGLRVALAAEGSSFGMLSGGDSEGSKSALVYRLLAPGTEPPQAEVLPVDERSYDDAPFALVQLKGEMFFAATQAHSGEEIVVGRLPRP